MATSSTSNSTNSPMGLSRTLDSGRDEGTEKSNENSHSTAGPAMPALISVGSNDENEENGENKADGEDANSATSPNHDDTPPVVYSPVNGDYSPGRGDDEAPLPPLHQRDVRMGVNVQAHGIFLRRLADALGEATADHVATYNYVERSLNDLQEQILRRVKRSGDAARYLPMYFEDDPEDPRKMKRRRRSPSSVSEERDTCQSSSCGPGCSGS